MGKQKPRDYSKQGFTTYYKKKVKSSRSEAKALAWYSYEEEQVLGVSRRLCICILSLSADPLVLNTWPDPTHIHTVVYTNLHTKSLSFSHKNTLHETRHRIWQWALPCSPTWNWGLPCIWNLTSQERYFLYQEGPPFGWWSHVAIRLALPFFWEWDAWKGLSAMMRHTLPTTLSLAGLWFSSFHMSQMYTSMWKVSPRAEQF